MKRLWNWFWNLWIFRHWRIYHSRHCKYCPRFWFFTQFTGWPTIFYLSEINYAIPQTFINCFVFWTIIMPLLYLANLYAYWDP